MATQRFCLRWNNHQSNMLSVFDQLLHAETFTDVTLAVDGQLLKAHKMVLSACSPYFQALFVNHQEKHPIVILKDVPYSDMKSLLDFMYRGEVSVDQERLTAFLKVAESLRIKGLTEVNEEKCDIPALTNSLIQHQQTNTTAHTPPPQLHRIHPYMHQKRPASGMPTGGAPPNLLMPLLGNALMQPKRKRGRPRKLSGSSSDALNTAASPPGEFIPESAAHATTNRPGDQLIRGSPEMLEVKMSMDGFNNTEDGATSGGEDAGEALLIDEGDDAQSTEAHTGKDSESAGRGTPDDENKDIKYEQSPSHEGKIRINPATQASTSNEYQNDSLNNNTLQAGGNQMQRPSIRRRIRRRANSASNDPAEQLTEMSVRGLNLFRYASVNEGVYQCTECAKENIQKTFKNKYSFQRHAFLYHEGQQRKVFPCPVCCKEFSRPDKMKNHMKTTHDCYVPKDCVYTPNAFFMLPGMEAQIPSALKIEESSHHPAIGAGSYGSTPTHSSPDPTQV
ncbi:protein tramtrack, alpha isoform-like isoform X3 [Ostrinia nubilalis]|uniref:protein tramtrack, alpha isoform-like isoform X2 n=1 Tax=Ostrinia furnacalis TaxID=93504 RepID=UPI001039E67F|nr:protein tramtrack, alpha isoform-like isoform X2 [Ostrinia furnacalis]